MLFQDLRYAGRTIQHAPGFALTVVLVAALDDSSLMGQLLAVHPLRWVGKISYGLYLWHFPVIILGVAAFGNGEQTAITCWKAFLRLPVMVICWRRSQRKMDAFVWLWTGLSRRRWTEARTIS